MQYEVDGHCVVNKLGVVIADCSDEENGKSEERARADAHAILQLIMLVRSTLRTLDRTHNHAETTLNDFLEETGFTAKATKILADLTPPRDV